MNVHPLLGLETEHSASDKLNQEKRREENGNRRDIKMINGYVFERGPILSTSSDGGMNGRFLAFD